MRSDSTICTAMRQNGQKIATSGPMMARLQTGALGHQKGVYFAWCGVVLGTVMKIGFALHTAFQRFHITLLTILDSASYGNIKPFAAREDRYRVLCDQTRGLFASCRSANQMLANPVPRTPASPGQIAKNGAQSLILAVGLRLAILLGMSGVPSATALDLTPPTDRQLRFESWREAHPSTKAQFTEILAKTASLLMIEERASGREPIAELIARPHGLSPEQRRLAQVHFRAGYELWQSGDLGSARKMFKAGLEIDPADGIVNYDYGRLLRWAGDASGARRYLERAAAMAPGPAESLRALGQLRQISIGGRVNDPPKVFRLTDAPMEIWDGPETPEMVLIPAGEFTMGSRASEQSWAIKQGSEVRLARQESPRHRVVLIEPVAIAKYAVSVGEFARFVAETGYDAGNQCHTFEHGRWRKRSDRNWRNPGFPQDERYPVVCVNWYDAKAYAAWLSLKTQHQYRLLTEAEWEYATRAGTTTRYFWSDDPDVGCDYANAADLTLRKTYPTWPKIMNCQDGHLFTAPVGSFRPNAFGLYDMVGNVWQWTEDCYIENYKNAPSDGSAAKRPDSCQRVYRGGSWNAYPRVLRSANRNRNAPDIRGLNLGFRLARALP